MPDSERRLSVVEAYRGRQVLLTGGSGFLGKVFLCMLLDKLPELGKIYVFMRPRASSDGRTRLQNLLNTSEAFRPLHEKYGDRLSAFLDERLEVVEGDLGQEGLGLPAALLTHLRRELDVVVHCAGLVDFEPDFGKALSSNVAATLRVADFVESCKHATMLHVSTCFVAGNRSGFIPERLVANYTPTGRSYDARTEYEAALRAVASTRQSVEEDSEEQARDLAKVAQEHPDWSQGAQQSWVRRQQRERLRTRLVEEGRRRAAALGFPNIYTYTKCLAESLLKQRAATLRYAVLRPSIVESARSYPFPSWNESFNGSAPLAYVMGGWFRMVPARPEHSFDVVPVDEVGKAMVLVGAALIAGCAGEVYQIGTSQRYPCSVGRSAELIVLAHRQYHRGEVRTPVERVLKSRWDATLVSPDHPLGVQGLGEGASLARHLLDLAPPWWRPKLANFEDKLEQFEDRLGDIRKLVRLYMPFMYEHGCVFECRAIDAHPPVESAFRFFEQPMDWRGYWLNVHMPGLRRYAFPLIEGRRPPRYRAEHRIRLSATTWAGKDVSVPQQAWSNAREN